MSKIYTSLSVFWLLLATNVWAAQSLDELEYNYPQFFTQAQEHLVGARGCGKTLTRLVLTTQYYFSQCFKYKLQHSDKSLTREEYEAGLRSIEKNIWEL